MRIASILLASFLVAVLHVRGVPDELYEELSAEAKREGRSIGAQTIFVLEEALERRRQRDEFVERLARFRARVRLSQPLTPPEDIIRRFRDGAA